MKKFESKKISDNELTLVSGGTVEEMWELAERMCAVQSGALRHSKWIMKANNYLQNSTKVGKVAGPLNKLMVLCIEGYLNEVLDVKADISIGFLGTGVNEDPNRYSHRGRRISHQEVLSMMR